MSRDIRDLEHQKFRNTVGSRPAAAVILEEEWDLITPTFNATSDVYIYSKLGLTLYTITVNYADATKAIVTSITRA